MNILGVNSDFARPKEATPDGLRHPLSDGSAALLVDGTLAFAGIEERHTRRRYEGGFGNAVCAFWESEWATNIESVDVVAFSSCCGPRWVAQPTVEEEIEDHLPSDMWGNLCDIPRPVVVDHHDSHASLGFVLSGAERALVAVVDGFGNLLQEDGWNPGEWWRGKFERHSYYVAERLHAGFRLRRVAEDAEGFDDVGLGEAYRALTHFCGWNSYQQAGSAMALAAFGDPEKFREVPFVEICENQIRCNLANDHPTPGRAMAKLLKRSGHRLPPLLGRTATPEDVDYCAVVRAMQDQLAEAVCARLLGLATEHHANTIVVTGGVAMNCLAMGELQRQFPGRIFVPPAPSDTGQGLGNAIWAQSCVNSPCFSPRTAAIDLQRAPFWGIPANDVRLAAKRAARHPDLQVTEDQSEAKQYQMAAEVLAIGKVVAVAMGRAEYGPRALGRRSVLADPRDPTMSRRANRFKRREEYRPFAPAILQEDLSDYCECAVESPFMSFAVPVRGAAKARIPAVVHADGTARVQTVGRGNPSPLRPILEHFRALTGVPVLLNTSFNRKGEPMVQTAVEAVDAFVHSDLDVLLLDGVTIQRKQTP